MSSEEKGIRFSVIIPTYNAAATIERAVESALMQSYEPLEVIIVDDASTDNTADLVKNKYGDNITFIQKISNGGSSAARNTGMDAAKGDYIAFLDADDLWHRDKLMLMNTILAATPEITLFYHPYTQDNITGKPLPENIPLFRLPFIKLLPSNPIATSCIVVRNNPAFRFEPGMRYTEDYDFAMRIGYKHKIYFINIPLTQIFRKFTSAGGISANTWKMRRGEMKAYSRLVKLNPLFTLLLPVLLVSSIGKHIYKKLVNSDKGYFEKDFS
ncbi:MAG: putative glycosyltransferase O-antigen related protein [Flavipsychrobacter sp.]|nr:putative glycosyltransferase O-antigen related protein [Flavipsychrobacter sp.]